MNKATVERTGDDGLWGDIDAVGKGRGKGKGKETRRCNHCHRVGHLAKDCFFKHLPQDQTQIGYHNKMIRTGQYAKGPKSDKGGFKGGRNGGSITL